MGISLQRLDQLHKPDTFDDSLDASGISGIETSAVDFADYHEGVISQIKRIIYGSAAGNWHDDVEASADSLKDLAARATLEGKNILSYRLNYNDVTVPAAQNWVELTLTGKPDKAIAVSASLLGAATAQLAGAIGSHDLAEIAGSNPLRPKNFCLVFDGATGDAVLSSDRQVYALLQVGTDGTDGNAFGDSGNDQGQLSFVRPNATFDDLEACPVADIQGKAVIYSFSHRNTLNDAPEEAFRGELGSADPQAGVTVSLDAAYDGGNFMTVDGSDVDIRLADSKDWVFRKGSGGAIMFQIQRDDGGSDVVQIAAAVDSFDVDAAASDFAQGAAFDTSDQTINVGKTAVGVLDSASIEMRATTGDAVVQSASADVKFVTSRQTALPLDDATAGSISALAGGPHASVAAAIKYALESGGVDLAVNVFVAGSSYAQGANIPAATLDLTEYSVDANTPGSTNAFLFLNGRLLYGGNVTTKNDVYVGTTAADGDLKVDFSKGIKTGDILITVGLKA